MPAWSVALATLPAPAPKPARRRGRPPRRAQLREIPRDNVWSMAIGMLPALGDFRDAERAPCSRSSWLLDGQRHHPTASRRPVKRHLERRRRAAIDTPGQPDRGARRASARPSRCCRHRRRQARMLAAATARRRRRARELIQVGSIAPRRHVPRWTSAWRAPRCCFPAQDGARARPAKAATPSRPRGRRGAWTTRPRPARTRRKGMRHLALLLANPGVEFHAVDVASAAEGRPRGRGAREGCRAGAGGRPRAGLPGQGRALLAPGGPAGRDRGGRRLQRPERRAVRERDGESGTSSAAVGSAGATAGGLRVRARPRGHAALRREIRRIADEDASLGRGEPPSHRHLLRLRAGSLAAGGRTWMRLSVTTSPSSDRASAAGGALPARAAQRPVLVLSAASHGCWRLPRTPRQRRCALWAPSGRHGLFEYHHFKGLDALTASGLGGARSSTRT
jgi:hypothetical protein